MLIRRALVASLALTVASLKAPGPTQPIGPGTNVLFIGNSLTYSNDLPSMVASVAQSAGISLQVRALATSNYALIDFLVDGTAQREIAKGGWKYVVMQQGPTTLPICRDTLVIAVKNIDALAKSVGAQSVVMMSWPTTERAFDFSKVHESAQMAAETVGGKLAPVGDAWQLANRSNPSLAFYGPDGYHPSPLGTYLAALVIFEQVTGVDARTLPLDSPTFGNIPALSRDIMQLLHDTAHSANVNGFATPVPTWTPAIPPVPGITC